MPKSPSTPNFSEPSRLGSGMTSLRDAGASTATTAGRGAPQVLQAPAAAATATTAIRLANGFGMASDTGQGAIDVVDDEVRVVIEEDQALADEAVLELLG